MNLWSMDMYWGKSTTKDQFTIGLFDAIDVDGDGLAELSFFFSSHGAWNLQYPAKSADTRSGATIPSGVMATNVTIQWAVQKRSDLQMATQRRAFFRKTNARAQNNGLSSLTLMRISSSTL